MVNGFDIANDTYDATNHAVKVNVIAGSAGGGSSNANWQATMANSSPVVIASNQSSIPVAGDTASGSTDSGNPLKIGGRYNTTQPTFTDGQRGDIQLGLRGNVKVELTASASNQGLGTGSASDGDGGTLGLVVSGRNQIFNGTSWDRHRGNEEATPLSSSARTTTQVSSDIVNYSGLAALILVLDVTSAGTGSVTLSVDGKDAASGKYYNLLTGAAVTTNSTNRYRISPFLAAVANAVAQDHVPRIFRVTVTANNANTVTYSVGYVITRS